MGGHGQVLYYTRTRSPVGGAERGEGLARWAVGRMGDSSATGDLPDGWTYGGLAEDGKHYYNSPNGVTWSPPMVLPDGWVQVVDAGSGYC